MNKLQIAWIVVIVSLVGLINIYTKPPIKQEYTNQTNVKIYSHSTKLTYICTFEEINETLLKDNL